MKVSKSKAGLVSRRQMMVGGSALLVSLGAGAPSALAHHGTKPDKKYNPQNVTFKGYKPGQILIDRKNHFLYWTMSGGKARRYGIGVGKAGQSISGRTRVAYKAKWPRWTPTPSMIERNPSKYGRWKNGMPGGKNNPLGARALYLYRGKRDTLFRIHGTNQPWTIGRNESAGCVRMVNDHVKDLYNRVPSGTYVTVIS